MKPDNTHSTSSAARPSTSSTPGPARESAVNLIREQLHTLYSSPAQQKTQAGQVAASQSISQAKAAAAAKIEQTTQPAQTTQPTQAAQPVATSIDAEQWKHYHSAWQEYYQKYYQQYYTGYAHKVIKQHTAQIAQQVQQAKPVSVTAQTPEPVVPVDTTDAKKTELNKLREKLLGQARQSAKKVRGSRHFIPLAAAICVVLLFSFLQYNQLLMGNVQAYISPGAIDSQNVVVDPTSDVTVSPDPKLIIPKLNIDVPVVYGVGADDKAQLAAMEHGVAHWPGGDQAKSVPGQAGNTVIAGHSSNDLFESGDYKFIFSQLDRLEKGDTIYANYEGKRYTYSVTKKDIILPKGQWQNVITATDKPMLVLVTCWPLGTAQKRMLVTAEQVSPDPTAVQPASPATDTVETTDGMTGTSPTLFEWFFGLFS